MLVIIDYGMGNLRSVLKAFERLAIPAIVSSDFKDILAADHLILPGVGHFKNGMERLAGRGLIDILTRKVQEEKTPILGICLGMQLFTNFSEEGEVPGLGWIDARVERFSFAPGSGCRVPHIGWNTIQRKKSSQFLDGISEKNIFYFVHSYHVVCAEAGNVLGTTEYGGLFTSIIQKDNIFATQFHPEKSHSNGLILLKNFSEML